MDDMPVKQVSRYAKKQRLKEEGAYVPPEIKQELAQRGRHLWPSEVRPDRKTTVWQLQKLGLHWGKRDGYRRQHG